MPINNNDLNYLINKALSTKPYDEIIEEFKKIIVDDLNSKQITCQPKEIRTPFSCIGVRRMHYRYRVISSTPAAKITRSYIKAMLGELSSPYLSANTVKRLRELFEDHLNSRCRECSPTDIDALAYQAYIFASNTQLIDFLIRDTEEHPKNIKITFFKRIISLMSNVFKVFSR